MKNKNLIVNCIVGIASALVGVGTTLIIQKIKNNKKENKEFDGMKEELSVLLKKDEDTINNNVAESKKATNEIDQIFLVPIKEELISQIGFGMLGAIKTSSGHDKKGDYNIRLIIGAMTSMEVKEYSGYVEGFKVFTDDLSARTFVTEYLQNKNLNKSKSREEYIKRLSNLLQENKEYEEKGGD